MSPHDKPLVWLHGVIATPPFSAEAKDFYHEKKYDVKVGRTGLEGRNPD